MDLKGREAIEESWMKKLNTLYPYGLNVRAKTCQVMDAVNEVEGSKLSIYSKFDKVTITRRRRGRGRTRSISDFNASQFISNLIDSDTPTLRSIRTGISQLNIRKVKLVYLESVNRLRNRESVWKIHLLRVVKDISLFKCRNVWEHSSKSRCNQFLVVNYVNKYVEDIGLSKILKASDIRQLFPGSGHSAGPTVSYKYQSSIRGKILNYRKTHDDNLDPTLLTCDCADSTFKHQHHQHVITGNLDIIENVELRNMLKKGLNYRDQAPPSKRKAFAAVKDALDNYVKKHSSRNSKPVEMFAEWKHTVLDLVRSKLDQFPAFDYNSVLSKPDVIDYLRQLQCKYVFIPTDKAANNVSIVCKKFYVQLIRDEILSNTYELSSESVDEIISRHEKFLLEHGIKLHPDNKCLPYLYATTKMHKNPVKFRFITSGAQSSLKQLSIAVGLVLQKGLKVAKNNSLYVNNFYPRNDHYVIDSNSDVLDFMFDNNLYSGRKGLTTFDFSTLYTSIPHFQLKDNLSKFVDRIFDIKCKQFVVCNTFLKSAYFTDSVTVNKSCVKFSKQSLLDCIFYLIDNAYVIHNNCVYRQVIGIPMGTNSGPHVANIYLHQYEFDYFTYLLENNLVDELKKLQYVFRFQDDLISAGGAK